MTGIYSKYLWRSWKTFAAVFGHSVFTEFTCSTFRLPSPCYTLICNTNRFHQQALQNSYLRLSFPHFHRNWFIEFRICIAWNRTEGDILSVILVVFHEDRVHCFRITSALNAFSLYRAKFVPAGFLQLNRFVQETLRWGWPFAPKRAAKCSR